MMGIFARREPKLCVRNVKPANGVPTILNTDFADELIGFDSLTVEIWCS